MGFFGLVRNENVFAYFIVEKCSVWFWLNSHNNIFQFATHTKSVRHYHFPSFIWYFVQSVAQKKYLLKCCNDERERERKKCKTERKMHKSDKYSGNPKTKSPAQIKSRKKNSAISCCNIQFRHTFWTFCWQSPYEIYSQKR